ncbi:aldehyde dehydrogenase family protein [Microbacterium sp. C7(2022)]|uniref:aldehyde dehydrogenase family protein n=1 Tax=Microbacterium sp. C7(2022) TaxID=2992759 RepID=UPI00237B756F|nr:aldehyde dehydrogenase family protein [Microbacterium sp. C7(2022)]MDE0546366.1 aldehyde dehydrogenase family protein [Microbacterium sp. C7(2022)]
MSTIAPESPSAMADHSALGRTERSALDQAISDLAAGERSWAATPLAERAALLQRTHTTIAASAEDWALTAGRVKGLSPDSPLMGEEWISGPYPTLTGFGQLAHSLAALAARKSPLEGTKFGTAPGRRTTVKVLPHSAYEAILLHGFHAEVWLRPGIAASTASAHAGLAQHHPARTNGIGLVLGAGNITSIAPLDVAYELIAHNRVVLLKLNPTMDDMHPVFTRALAPLIEAGVLRIVRGGAEAGRYLTRHPDISHVHITGSSITHDAIVYGAGDEGAQRKADNDPALQIPITSELGGVAPVIVVPGKWSKKDLRYQAEHVATMRLHNGGYNCIAGQVVFISEHWPQKHEFLAELRDAMNRAPARPAWYPGSDTRLASALESYPDATRTGESGCRVVVELDAQSDATPLQRTEYFAPVLGVRELPATGQDFLDAAVSIANDELTGTLGANVIIAPRDRKRMGAGFDQAIAALRYGTIGVNAWTGVGYLTANAPWGAYPGHTLDDIQSGRGVVHNALLIADTERTVVTGPFRPFPRSIAGGELALFPKPPWFVTARSAAATGRLLAGFAAAPGWLKMPAVFAAAFRA